MPEFSSYDEGTPCWVDVTSTDLDATNAFYGALFGWEARQVPDPAAGGYTMYVLNGKHVAAASSPPPGADLPPHWTTYLASGDVEATAARIREEGGSLLAEPFDVLDSGRMCVAADPTGAVFAVWQAGTHVGAELANEPGTLSWNEAHSPDPAAAAAFYADVFGLTVSENEMGGPEPYRVLEVGGRGVAGVSRLEGGDPPSWLTVFAVADCDDVVARARELGGTVHVEPAEIPTVGRYAVLADPLGAVFGALA